jgi:hypothetical protein
MMSSWRMSWDSKHVRTEKLIGTPEGTTQLGRIGHRWVNKIKMALRNRVWQCELGSGKSQMASSCEQNNESFEFHKRQ